MWDTPLMSGLMLMCYSKNTKPEYKEGTVLMSFIWSTADVLMVKWMDTEPLSASIHPPPPPCHSQTSTEKCSAAPHNTPEHAPHSHSFLCSFCFHLKQKTIPANFATRCTGSTICHVSVYLQRICLLLWLNSVKNGGGSQTPGSSCAVASWEQLEVSGCLEAGWLAGLLPLHVVQVPWHAQASDGVEFAVVHQAVVSAAGHRHPGHQIPVVQQGHVAPHVSHHHTGLCAAWNIRG